MGTQKDYFDEGFVPAKFDIVIGRQKMANSHSGNLKFTEITESFLEDYKNSVEDKTRKSQILAETFDAVRRLNGRFVKLDTKEKRWYEVTKSVARERISQQYRDSLKGYYKSSLDHKKKRRLVKNGVLPADDPTLQIQSPPPPAMRPSSKRPKLAGNGQERESNPASTTETPPTDQSTAKLEPSSEGQESSNDSSAGLVVQPTGLPTNHTELQHPTEAAAADGDTKADSGLPKGAIILMEDDYAPHKNDVIVGLRKRSAQHPGNMHLVEVVTQFLEEYKSCGSNKNKKSDCLNRIADTLTQQDPPTRFVKLEPKHQRWYEIEAFYAREKISQCARDLVQDGYRSANTFKNLKRRKSSSIGNPTGNSEGKPQSLTPTIAADNKEGASEHPSNKRLPPKKDVARKDIGANPALGTTAEANQTQPQVSKKEQLERQIEQLKKELEHLEEEECKTPEEGLAVSSEGGATNEQKEDSPALESKGAQLSAVESIVIVDDAGPEQQEPAFDRADQPQAEPTLMEKLVENDTKEAT